MNSNSWANITMKRTNVTDEKDEIRQKMKTRTIYYANINKKE